MQRFLKKIKMQMSMTFQEKKVTRHVGEWILNTYSPTAYFGRIGEWLSTTLLLVRNVSNGKLR
jgi:hypothetical protein